MLVFLANDDLEVIIRFDGPAFFFPLETLFPFLSFYCLLRSPCIFYSWCSLSTIMNDVSLNGSGVVTPLIAPLTQYAETCRHSRHLFLPLPFSSSPPLTQLKRQVSSNDFSAIESLVKNIIKEKQPFERLVLTKSQLLELFKHNPFKQRIIREKVQTESTTVYRCGPLIDLCRGPHIRW